MARRDLIPAWVDALASGREPVWTPIACGLLTLFGWLGPELAGLPPALALAAFAGAYVTGGASSLVRSISTLSRRSLDIDLLMLLSAAGAALIGELVEGATLLFLFSLSNSLEARALARTTRAIEALMELRPDEAMLLADDGLEERVSVEALRPGQVVRVRPGERIPADGHIRAGHTAVDQAAVTGESVPVSKGEGEGVFAGTINVGGTVEVVVDRPAGESTLARIIHLVEEAREAKAPTQSFIDRFEQGYAATVIFAAAAAIALPLAFGEPFRETFYRAMTLLVVASPCALVISTPATLLAALAHAARRGMLFKGGAPLEALASLDAVAFDKTGTLTAGRPTVTEVLPFPGTEEVELLTVAAAVERLSEHHLGRAIVEAAARRGLALPGAENLSNTRGQGVVARVDGIFAAVGRQAFVDQAIRGQAIRGPALRNPALRDPEDDAQPGPGPELAARLETLAEEGATVVHAGWITATGEARAGALAITDPVRPEAREAVAALREAGIGRLVLLTGDNAAVARKVATAVGVEDFQADLMPEEKVEAIRALRGSSLEVAMVGDGVNDAPALAAASVGVAMGVAGTDAALETADLVLVRDDLSQLAYALLLARKARRVVHQNLAFASAVIAVLVIVNLIHGLPLPLGVVGHEGSTILVVLNGLRLLRGVGPSVEKLSHTRKESAP